MRDDFNNPDIDCGTLALSRFSCVNEALYGIAIEQRAWNKYFERCYGHDKKLEWLPEAQPSQYEEQMQKPEQTEVNNRVYTKYLCPKSNANHPVACPSLKIFLVEIRRRKKNYHRIQSSVLIPYWRLSCLRSLRLYGLAAIVSSFDFLDYTPVLELLELDALEDEPPSPFELLLHLSAYRCRPQLSSVTSGDFQELPLSFSTESAYILPIVEQDNDEKVQDSGLE
ncbi:hypothetical protein BGZ59_010622 [Podila verticillata]|nr:hypothetical protein BGZ59_010622 [Podila verticillata]